MLNDYICDVDMGDSPSGDTAKVVLVCDDVEAGIRDKHLLRHLAVQLVTSINADHGTWRFDLSDAPDWDEQVVRHIRAADVVVVSMSSESSRVSTFTDWVRKCLPHRDKPTVLVAVVPAGAGGNGTDPLSIGEATVR